MKKVILLLLLATVSCFATAQLLTPAQVPSSLRDSLRNKFPNGQNIEWNKAGADYTAKFSRAGGANVEVNMDAGGHWKQVQVLKAGCCYCCPSCVCDSLRNSVQQKIQTAVSGYNQKAAGTLHIRGKAPYTLLVLEKAGKESRMAFDASGNVVKLD